MKNLRELFVSTRQGLFIIDQDLAAEIFHAYMSSSKVSVRLLTKRNGDNLGAAMRSWARQHPTISVEARRDPAHDRLMFIKRLRAV